MKYKSTSQEKMSIDEDEIGLEVIEPVQEALEKKTQESHNNSKGLNIRLQSREMFDKEKVYLAESYL